MQPEETVAASMVKLVDVFPEDCMHIVCIGTDSFRLKVVSLLLKSGLKAGSDHYSVWFSKLPYAGPSRQGQLERPYIEYHSYLFQKVQEKTYECIVKPEDSTGDYLWPFGIRQCSRLKRQLLCWNADVVVVPKLQRDIFDIVWGPTWINYIKITLKIEKTMETRTKDIIDDEIVEVYQKTITTITRPIRNSPVKLE